MPQLDQFTYFSQFFWLCLFLFTFYILICNDGNGVLGISRILKLRKQLLSHRGNKIQSKDPKSFEDILRKGFSTGVSYMDSTLFEVSQWCKSVDLLGKKRKFTLIPCRFRGDIFFSRKIERTVLFYILNSYCQHEWDRPFWNCRSVIDGVVQGYPFRYHNAPSFRSPLYVLEAQGCI